MVQYSFLGAQGLLQLLMFVPVLRYIPALHSADAAMPGAKQFHTCKRTDTKLPIIFKAGIRTWFCVQT